MMTKRSALLALEDGSLFYGDAIGFPGETVGEVVFNTSMTGYQEILTDPSYARQLVTLTYPHIGNIGVNSEDEEAPGIYADGLIIRDLSMCFSNWRGQKSLHDYLNEHKKVGISGLDTRYLTRLLRDKGAQRGCISVNVDSPEEAIKKAQAMPSLEGLDLAKEVSCHKSYSFNQTTWDEKQGYQEKTDYQYHIVAYDFGVKRNILRLLVDRSCRITVVPAKTSAEEVLAMQPDGVFLSNGPGDPAACTYAIDAIKKLLDKNIPLFGICLGFQLLALASGAKTFKMKFGHHGANHPVQHIELAKVMISSQNHGFAVDESTLPAEFEVTHRSLFDNTLQGIIHRHKFAFGFQGHPEASPGPHDVVALFDKFIEMINYAKTN